MAFALTAKAQDSQELLVEHAAEELTDGTIISLQCRMGGAATNGGGQYFNGEYMKSTLFTTYMLYVIERDAENGIKLRRLADGKYVGRTGTNVKMTGDAQSAVTFTAESVGDGGVCDAPSLISDTNRDLLVRFNVKDEATNLALNSDRVYNNTTDGKSVWYVYAYHIRHENTVRNAEAELLDGTVIALQSRDYNGGAGYYFNGEAEKTPTFSANNLFVVEGSAKEGMRLRRLVGDKYIGKSDNAVTEVDGPDNAATFTVQSYRGGKGFSQFSHTTELDGTLADLYVRFSVTEGTNTTYLNTQSYNDDPQYVNNPGGYSAWYVYKFPECSATLNEASLSFNCTGSTAANVDISVDIPGGSEGKKVEVTLTSDKNLKNGGFFSSDILCPFANLGNDQTASLKFTFTNLPDDFSFSQVLLKIHALDGSGYYQSGSRYCNITLSCGEGDDKAEWAELTNFDITPIINWPLTGEPVEVKDGKLVLTLDIKKGTSNGGSGIFFGLSGIRLIGERISEVESGISEEAVTKMNADDVQDLLADIKSGYKRIGYDFPAQVSGADVKWPQALENVFSGLDSNFELLTHAENGENLDAAKKNLADFIRISNKKYPVSVAYTATADYGTLYMPFAVEHQQLPAGLAFLQCEEVDEDGVLIFSDNDQDLAANTSFIVKVIDNGSESESPIGKTTQFIGFYDLNTQANSDSPLKGTHEDIPAPLGSYVLQMQTYGLGFYKVGDGGKEVPAGKCYLDLTGANAQGLQFLRFPDGTLTAIDAIDAAEPANAATYDLSGRRVTTTTTRGLYIMGGRKVLVK